MNTARGEIVSLFDIAAALENGKVRGVALDVLENEKLNTLTQQQMSTFNLMRKKTNVLFTPHIAGWTFESHIKINVALIQKINALQLV